MKENLRTINIIVELLKRSGIKRIVISPGGTNIEFVKRVQNDSFFTCYSVVDERSAMYFAIGLYLQTGEIIVTSCTSAQATRNYIPGLTEAYYKRVPVLAITMEKHPRFIGQEYMQAPDQASLPIDSVKKSFVMPYITDLNAEYYAIRTANEAIYELTNNGMGPVQLVVPWVDFEINKTQPNIKKIDKYIDGREFQDYLIGKRIMIVIGEHRPFSEKLTGLIDAFCEAYNCVVYTNHLSNFHGKYNFEGNFVFSTITEEFFAKNYSPDILISIGGQTGDYPFYLIMSKPELSNTEHWRVNEDGKIIDTYDKLVKVFSCTEEAFFSSFEPFNNSSHEYYNTLVEIDKKINRNIELPFSHAYIAQQMSTHIPEHSNVQFAILHSLRVWNLFKMNYTVNCYSNVGAFGIDGGMSTLIGQSMCSDRLCIMITGDLAFFYDMNSLGIRGIKKNVRILVVNNNGGVEFKLGGSNKETDKFIAAANHFKNAKGWAETCGFRYIFANNKNEFHSHIEEFLSASKAPILYEVFVNDNDEGKAYQSLIRRNRQLTLNDVIQKGFRKIIR